MNIIIKGIEDEEQENEKETKDKICIILQEMGVKIAVKEDIDEVRRMGKYNIERKRPIIVKLNRKSTRTMILQKTRSLKGTNIWIDEDYPKEVQEERRKLIIKMKEARNKGHKAQLRYNKLIINDELYREKDTDQNQKSFPLLYGLKEEDPQQDIVKLIDIVKNQLNLNCNFNDFRDTRRIGTITSTKPRPLIIECVSYYLKAEILGKSKILKGSKLFFAYDLTQTDYQRKKILGQNLKLAKSYNLKANIEKNSLYVEDKEYKYEDLIKIPNAIETLTNNKRNTTSEENQSSQSETKKLKENSEPEVTKRVTRNQKNSTSN
ncbi:unnamed protein product [Psylliodes chrysocephalus]|uniref:Uncharacterized protein n=1 Tax=Psylliodes chrysocephalus TaxID=3402493 RepID=A0A9P0CZH0_9CUCU|nr:unnamed protein product [Psylliodes chrysocephala]